MSWSIRCCCSDCVTWWCSADEGMGGREGRRWKDYEALISLIIVVGSMNKTKMSHRAPIYLGSMFGEGGEHDMKGVLHLLLNE